MSERIITDVTNESFDVFRMFDKQWALAAAGSAEDCNAMTIGWGTLGTIWGPAGIPQGTGAAGKGVRAG